MCRWCEAKTVIASEAKQSRATKKSLDCFASLAMTSEAAFGPTLDPVFGRASVKDKAPAD